MILTKNFTLEELVVSETAKMLGINNTPNQLVINSLKALCENVLQPLREKQGEVIINSAFRNFQLNTAVGGAANSQHIKGEAADIRMKDMRVAFSWIRENLKFDQLIWEYGNDNQPEWIHVSYSQTHNRNEVLRIKKGSGYYKI